MFKKNTPILYYTFGSTFRDIALNRQTLQKGLLESKQFVTQICKRNSHCAQKHQFYFKLCYCKFLFR